ncbi:sulfatase [Halocatena marina]|uniref:Sulfatase n=1 Tax=Halocatena marina TaxID=2934937 RepID=A0ABD5YX56_9EURY
MGSVPDVAPKEYPPLPANHAVPPYEPKIIRDTIEDHWAMGAMEDASSDEWREYRHAYYRLIEKVDDRVDQILTAFRGEGLEDNTLVIFTSDHGDSHGAHQTIQKSFFYEEMVRVPFIVHPLRGTGGHVDEHLVSNGLDLLPTLCDYAEIEPPDELPGRSVRPLVRGDKVTDWRGQVVAQTSNGAHVRGRMVRTEKYKYIVYHEQRNNEQLFDTEDDPGEMVDLTTVIMTCLTRTGNGYLHTAKSSMVDSVHAITTLTFP